MFNIGKFIFDLTKELGLGQLFKGKDAKLQEFQLKLADKMNEANARQIEVNKIEAQHKSIFVAGWRPFIGWCCGVSLAYHFILQPFILLILRAFNVNIEIPTLEIEQLSAIMFAMLGMSGYRTYEKIKMKQIDKK